MTFGEILRQIIDKTPGALAGAVMASDGIPVEEYTLRGADIDLTAVSVEFQRVLEQSHKVAGALYGENGGGLEELILVTTQHQLFFRQIDDEFFVAVALSPDVSPDGMLGKARFLVRSLLNQLREEL